MSTTTPLTAKTYIDPSEIPEGVEVAALIEFADGSTGLRLVTRGGLRIDTTGIRWPWTDVEIDTARIVSLLVPDPAHWPVLEGGPTEEHIGARVRHEYPRGSVREGVIEKINIRAVFARGDDFMGYFDEDIWTVDPSWQPADPDADLRTEIVRRLGTTFANDALAAELIALVDAARSEGK